MYLCEDLHGFAIGLNPAKLKLLHYHFVSYSTGVSNIAVMPDHDANKPPTEESVSRPGNPLLPLFFYLVTLIIMQNASD